MKPEPILILLAFAILQTACDRNIEPFDPSETPRQPDISRIFPAPEEDGSAGGSMGMPSGQPMPPRSQASTGDEGAPIRGTITLAPEQTAPAGAVVFVIARSAGVDSGPPLAVVRISEPRFPLDFAIGPADVMMPGSQFAGAVSLSARLDTDGNAMSRQPSDLEALLAAPIRVGSEGVALVLGAGSPTPAPEAAVSPPEPRVAGGADVSGTIRLAAGAKASSAASSTLFVIARAAGQGAGPPLAVLRISSPRFPLEFRIGQANVMIPTRRFEGAIALSARLDADGDAMTRLAGDLEGATPGPVQAGARDVEIRLE